MEEKKKDEKQELTNMISRLTIDYEDFLPETFPINYTTLNPLIKIKELQNKASDKSIDFKNTYNRINEIINKMVSYKYQDFNDTLFVYQDLYQKYKIINEITLNIISEHEIIKKKLFINFKKLLQDEKESKERNLIKMIYKRLEEIYNFILKFKKSVYRGEYLDRTEEEIEIPELEKNLMFYKINIISYLDFIKTYNLEENDFVLEIKIELNKCKQFLIKYLKNKVIEYIFKELSNSVILGIKIIKEFGAEKELKELIKNSFKTNLYLNLNKICKRYSKPNNFNSWSIKSNQGDIPCTFEKEVFEKEVLNYLLKVYTNLESINMKESIFKEGIMYEIKRLFSLNTYTDEVFQLTNIQDSLNYISLFANTNIERYINNTGELKYGEYNVYRKNFDVNLDRLIKLNNISNIKQTQEENKDNDLLEEIINYTEKQLITALKRIDMKMSFSVKKLLLNTKALKIDESNKRLNFYTQFINKMASYKECLNFLNYFEHFILIIDLIKGKYPVSEINKVENIKDYFIEPSKIYSKDDIRQLIYSIYTVNDLKEFLSKGSFMKIDSNSKEERSSNILIHMLNDLINDLRNILKYKLLITIYYYFDRYLREGIDFIKTIKIFFYGFNKTEISLITDLREFKKWECDMFINGGYSNEYSEIMSVDVSRNRKNSKNKNTTNNIKTKSNNRMESPNDTNIHNNIKLNTVLRNEFYGVFIESEKTKDAEKLFKQKFDKFYFSIIYSKINELVKEKHKKIFNKHVAVKNLMLLEELICSVESMAFHSYGAGNYETTSFLISYKLLGDGLH